MKVGLSLLLAALLGLVYLQWRDWPPQPEWESASDRTGAQAVGSGIELAPDLLARLDAREAKEAYSEVIERPLFQPDRRPPDEESETDAAAQESPMMELDGLDLTAVILTPEVTTAWVLDAPNRDLIKVRPGEDLAGWVVAEIREDRIVLERQGESDTLLLRTYSVPRAFPGPPSGAETRRSAPRRSPTPSNPQQRRNARLSSPARP